MRIELKPSQALYFYFRQNNISKIKEFFLKKNYQYNKDDFKPGSDKAIKAEQEHLRITLLPDHNIKQIGEVTFKVSYKKVSFTLMEHTYNVPITDYEYDDQESYSLTHKSRFFVENSHWGYGLITSYEELVQNIDYQNLLKEEIDAQLLQETYKELEEMPKCFSCLLLHKITEAKKGLKVVNYYREYYDLGKAVVITDPFTNDKKVYSQKKLTPIYQDMVEKKIFYDSSDCKIERKYGENYIDFHERASESSLIE